MKNIILTFLFILPLLSQAQDKNYPYSIMSWISDNVDDFNTLPPNAIDVNSCNLLNPVFGQNSADFDGVFNDLDCAVCTNDQINADNFSFASNQSIGSICWVGYFFSGTIGVPPGDCTPLSVPTFTIDYYQNAGGLPGTLIQSFNVTPTATATGNIIGGAFQTVFSAEHAPIDFAANTEYWLAIYTNIPNGQTNCDYAWDISNEGDGFGAVAPDVIPPIGGYVISFTDYTFFLGSTAPIPTLSQWGLIILSFLFIIIGAVTIKYPLRNRRLI